MRQFSLFPFFLLMLAATGGVLRAQSAASLVGAWTSGGRRTSISLDAGDSTRLVFTNENGLKSTGTLANASTVIATQWEGGLHGTLADNNNTIRWANGTAWFRATGPATLVGAWTSGGRPTSISLDAGDSSRLVFTNENGLKSTGTLANASTVIATQWEGGLHGTLADNNNTICWANGTAWFRAAGQSQTPASIPTTRTPPPPQAGGAQELTGTWRIWANYAGQGREMLLQLRQTGTRLEGLVVSTNQRIEGSVNGRAVEFSRSGGGLRVPQRYKGFLFERGTPPTMAGTFSHEDD